MRKFHFSSICNVLPCELRLFWYLTRVLNRHLANKLPTCGQQSADSRATVRRQTANSRPTVGQQLADCRLTVVQLSANFWPTVGRQFFGGAVLHFLRPQCDLTAMHDFKINANLKSLKSWWASKVVATESRPRAITSPRRRNLQADLGSKQSRTTIILNGKRLTEKE